MRRLRGEWVILLVALVATVGIVLMQQQRATDDDQRPGSVRNTSGFGMAGLYRWLDALDYRVQLLSGRRALPEPASNSVIWSVRSAYSIFMGGGEEEEREVDAVLAWVEAGGTLVRIQEVYSPSGSGIEQESLEEHLGIEPQWAAGEAEPSMPWGELSPVSYLRNETPLPQGAVPLLTSENSGAVQAFYLPYGDGGIWYFLGNPFYNFRLEQPENRALLIALVERLSPTATHYFDEREGGALVVDETVGSLARYMRSQPWGWGIYFSAGVIALWLLLRGRAFGRPVRPRESFLRREAGEFARSMGWLYQRTGQQEALLRHLHSRTRRRLIHRFRLDPKLDDEALARAIGALRPHLDSRALASHLKALQPRGHRPSNRELVALAQASDAWMQRLDV